MSEQINQGMPEYGLRINGEDYRANRKNTSLYTFIGENAMYDHVFCVIEEMEDGDIRGCYIFRTAQEELFYKLEEFCENNSLPAVLHRNEVPDCDKRAFDAKMFSDLNGETGVPEGWE